MTEPKIEFKNVHKDFFSKTDVLRVLEDINITVISGEFVSIIGPSGCGKSTILDVLTGIVPDYDGSVNVDGIPLEKSNKRMGYMQQKDLLMPWRTLMDNVLLPLEIQGENIQESKKRIVDMLPIFGLDGFEESYPHELSGGMRQRAALLRTILVDSDIMLLDEPFGALDAINRSKMQEWLLKIWNEYKHTVIFITHDIEEAIYLSDKIFILSNRPAKVLNELKIEFERPRSKDILVKPEFLEYKKKMIEALVK